MRVKCDDSVSKRTRVGGVKLNGGDILETLMPPPII